MPHALEWLSTSVWWACTTVLRNQHATTSLQPRVVECKASANSEMDPICRSLLGVTVAVTKKGAMFSPVAVAWISKITSHNMSIPTRRLLRHSPTLQGGTIHNHLAWCYTVACTHHKNHKCGWLRPQLPGGQENTSCDVCDLHTYTLSCVKLCLLAQTSSFDVLCLACFIWLSPLNNFNVPNYVQMLLLEKTLINQTIVIFNWLVN